MDSFVLWLLIGSFILIRSTEIEDSRVIVTGAANGIGYAYAHDLLYNGARAVAILDIDVENGTMATQRLADEFGDNRIFFFPTDVTDPIQFEIDYLMAVQFLGGLDIMINNAGIADDTMWSQMIDTNIKGVVQGTLMSIDVMGKHRGGEGGTVINIASTGSFITTKFLQIYVATKYAVLGFSRSIALNYNITGVAVKTMCPGATDTQMVRSKAHRYLDFVDYDEAVGFLGNMTLQRLETVSREVMRLIEEAPNGAIWVVEPNEPTISLDIPSYREWGTPV